MVARGQGLGRELRAKAPKGVFRVRKLFYLLTLEVVYDLPEFIQLCACDWWTILHINNILINGNRSKENKS